MYITEDKANAAVERYGDIAYKFAFILTMSDTGAEHAVISALAYLAQRDLIDADSEKNRRMIFNRIYKAAKKNRIPAMTEAEITSVYGEKSREFFEIGALPLPERAVEHLTLYEEYSPEQAKKIIESKIS